MLAYFCLNFEFFSHFIVFLTESIQERIQKFFEGGVVNIFLYRRENLGGGLIFS